jgi:hypothetical protein
MPDKSFTQVIPASGAATLRILSRPERWNVTQVSVKGSAAPSGSLCVLKKNGVFVTPIIASGGVATEPPALELRPNDVMTVEWTGHTSGTLFEIFVIYDVLPS